MGLFSRRASRRKAQEIKSSGGLLSRAQELSDSSKAEKEVEIIDTFSSYDEVGESEMEDGEEFGLLKKAEALSMESVGVLGGKATSGSDEKEGLGLLSRADTMIAEEGDRGGLLARAIGQQQKTLEEEIEPLEKEEVIEIEEREEVPEPVADTQRVMEEAFIGGETPEQETVEVTEKEVTVEEKPEFMEAEEEVMGIEVPVERAVKEEVAEAETAGEELEHEVAEKTHPELIKQYVESHNSVQIVSLLDEIVKNEGYSSLIDGVTEAFMLLAKGKSVLLYALSGQSYSVMSYIPEIGYIKKVKKKNFRKKSSFVEFLFERGVTVRSSGINDSAIQQEIAHLEDIEPWTVVPLVSIGVLTGFVLIGNQAKRPKIDRDGLNLFAHISSQYISRYVAEREYVKLLEKAVKENEEREAILRLYDLSDTVQKSLEQVLRKLYSDLGVEAAAIISGWNSKGKLFVLDSIGLSEKLIKKYSVKKNDKEILKIIEKREPSIPKDFKKRISNLSKEKVEQLKTYIVVPLVFEDEILGIMNVHKMRGAGNRLSHAVKLKLSYGAKALLPYLLRREMSLFDPFSVLESTLQKEMDAARKLRQSLHFIIFSTVNGNRMHKEQEYDRYFDISAKLYEIIKKNVKSSETVMRLDVTRTLLILNNLDDIEADEEIKKVKQEFNRRIAKQGQLRLSTLITRYPHDGKHVRDFIGKLFRIHQGAGNAV